MKKEDKSGVHQFLQFMLKENLKVCMTSIKLYCWHPSTACWFPQRWAQFTHILSLPLLTGYLRDHPQEGEGQEVHGGYERLVLEPAAGRAPDQRLAQWPAGNSGRPLAAQPYRHAAGLWGGDTHLLWRRADQAPRLPLCLHPGAVPRLLDWRGGQHHPLLHMKWLRKWSCKLSLVIRSTIKHGH